MGEGEQKTLQYRRLPNTLCRYSILEKVKHNCPLLKLDCAWWLPSKSIVQKRGKRVTLQRRNLNNTRSARWSRSTSTMISQVDDMYSWYDIMRMILCLSGLYPQNTYPGSNYEKNIRQIPIEGHFTKYLTNMPQNCQGHQKQGKPEKLSQPRVG